MTGVKSKPDAARGKKTPARQELPHPDRGKTGIQAARKRKPPAIPVFPPITRMRMAGFNAVTDRTSTLRLPGYGFWPELRVADVQREYRLPAEYAESLLLDHLALSRIWAVRQLRGWEKDMREAGYAALADVPLDGEEGGAQRLFTRAVYCHAKALLLGQFATMDRREAAKNEGKEGQDSADRFQAWAVEAIADLLDRPRITVGLL